MQQEGKPQFILAHSGVAKGVAFSPQDRYIFCSGGTDGKVNVYNALQAQPLMSTRISAPTTMKNINAVKFNSDGSRILSTTAKRLSVIDAERGEHICSYDNCAYAGKDRAPLASDPKNPFIATCGCTNGKGLITFDLRQQRPARYSLNIHSTLIKDIIYLDESWPFGKGDQNTVVSLSLDGLCKIRTTCNEDRELHLFDVKYRSNCITATPNVYSDLNMKGFESILMIGGDQLTGYMPGNEPGKETVIYGPSKRPIHKLKYTSNGHLLYAITSGGRVRRCRRTSNGHHFLGEVYSHNDEILDMDISPNDEYIVTASRDGHVGLMCLGAPSYGWTGFMELA